ncbi:hypothetical protein SPBR_02986 [Sporothrix brasiliensis 5110]|uniref:Uncharacterized protein n=1 Tax=Sporothrix brasiliensis 5110 TaxID=1398154 RepID=A0A0C2F1B6_9PEZI|nr:uncharacterized protein SPBR_02986 [Sporothrix brasiliensis 5110]KIH92669.1 hypothetical protein SPBR_02986 [Sporothrix brasiliensis 5110]
MLWKPIVVASVLARQAHAGFRGVVAGEALAGRTTHDWERRMAAALAEEANYVPRVVVKRAETNATAGTTMTTTTAGTGVVLNADGTINMTAWDNTATAACNAALTKLPESSNPSGTCICYNLPALDNTTGTFEADLRLFQLSTPSGEFEGIPPENIQVGLSYASASVSPVSVASASKLVVGRADTSANGSLRLLQQYLFVGQIKKDTMTPNMNTAQLEALVMPVLTLTGTNSNGKTVSTNVSSNEAAFVAGVFSSTVVMSTTAIAQAAVNELLNGLHNGTVAFVLPGVQIITFPIGLVIISVWLSVALAFIGFGMAERISYRETYKRRTVMSTKPSTSRI